MGLNQFRRDPITGRWTIIVWNKHTITDLIENRPSRILSDKEMSETRCTFCEGHENETPSEIFSIRHNDTQKNEPGWTVRVIPEFDPILQIYGDLNNRGIGMYDVLDGIGAHEIVIESPDHGVQIYQMEENQIQDILAAYRERILDLKKDERFRYILLHKNYGEGDGERIHHSYSQIIATPITPTRVKSELMNALEHYQYKERCIFCDVIHQESLDGERVILQNDRFMAFAPFASRAPFEVWILPKNHETFFEWTTELSSLAPILKQVLGKIHRVLRDPHYVMVLHSGPNMNAGKLRGYWKTLEKDYHWHIEITPRFRGYTSFEIGSGFQINTVPPEEAAKILREEKLT